MKKLLPFALLSLLLSACSFLPGGGSEDSAQPNVSDDSESTASDEPIVTVEALGFQENWDTDAEDDGLEFTVYFEDANGDSVSSTTEDWTAHVVVYENEDDMAGSTLFEKTFTADDLIYDSYGDPLIRINAEDIKTPSTDYGYTLVELESPTYGKFSSIDDFVEISF